MLQAGPQARPQRAASTRRRLVTVRSVLVLLLRAFEEPPLGERLVIIILHCQHIAVATRVQIANLHIIR